MSCFQCVSFSVVCICLDCYIAFAIGLNEYFDWFKEFDTAFLVMDRIVLDFDDQHEFTGGDVAVMDVGVYVHSKRSLKPHVQAS